MTKAAYLDELRRRRRSARPGEARAIVIAIGYLSDATPGRTAWALRDALSVEAARKGPFWLESRRALRRIVRELGRVAQ